MSDVNIALVQIANIRDQLAASTRFLGITPEFNLVSALFVGVVFALQSHHSLWWLGNNQTYILVWAGVLLAISIIGLSYAVVKARRLHGDLAMPMLNAVLQKILPFLVAGTVISWAIYHAALDSAWLLPGLWQILIGLLGFSVMSSLPRGIVWAALWYLLSGCLVLAFASQNGELAPWMMGVPFTAGQVLVGLILLRSDKEVFVSE